LTITVAKRGQFHSR